MKTLGLTCSIILLVSSIGLCKHGINTGAASFSSATGNYFFVVYKGEFLSGGDARRRKRETNKLNEPLVKGYNPCISELYKIEVGDTVLLWRQKLQNTFAPVQCIVSNNGKYIATFDSWYATQNDLKNTMVVYDSSGTAIANYSLEEIAANSVDASGSCFPGIHWRKETIFTNDSTIKITYSDKYEQVHKVKYDINRRKFHGSFSMSETLEPAELHRIEIPIEQ